MPSLGFFSFIFVALLAKEKRENTSSTSMLIKHSPCGFGEAFSCLMLIYVLSFWRQCVVAQLRPLAVATVLYFNKVEIHIN